MAVDMCCVMVVCCHDEWLTWRADALLARLLGRLAALSFVDQRFVCTNAESVSPVIEAAGYRRLPGGLPAGRIGPELPGDFKGRLTAELKLAAGSVGNVQLTVDAAHLLLRPASVERLFDRLLEEGDCHEVVLANTVDPHLYLEQGEGLAQIFDHPGLDRQKMPQLYRRAGVSISHGLRPRLGLTVTRALVAPWWELLPYQPRYHDFFEEQSLAMDGQP